MLNSSSDSNKRKRSPEDETESDDGREVKRNGNVKSTVTDEDKIVSDEEEASFVQSDFECLLGESFDFYGWKRENNSNFDDNFAEFLRLGLEAKRIYQQAVKFDPSICSEIEDLIPQLLDHCFYLINKGANMSQKQRYRFKRAKKLLNADLKFAKDEVESIDKNGIVSNIVILQYYSELYLKGKFDNDLYTEAKRLCTRSIMLKESAKKWGYKVAHTVQLMDEVFRVVSEHYERTAPPHEVEMNLALQNRRCKEDGGLKLNFYNRFLGSKKLKILERSPRVSSTPSLAQKSLKTVAPNNQVTKKQDDCQFKIQFHKQKIERLAKRFKALYINCQKYSSLCSPTTILSVHHCKENQWYVSNFSYFILLCQAPQQIKDARDLQMADCNDEKDVEVLRKIIESGKKIKEIFADLYVWYRNHPFTYYPATNETKLSKLKQKMKMRYFLFQVQLLKNMVGSYLKQKSNSAGFFEEAVQLATEIVRLNRRSLEHATPAAQTDIHKLTLRLYRQVVNHCEARTPVKQPNGKTQNKTVRKKPKKTHLHYFDKDFHSKQLSLESFLLSKNNREGSADLAKICEGYEDLNWEDERTSEENMNS